MASSSKSPTSEALGSQTPPKPSNASSEIKSTPMNAGTASVGEYRGDVTVPEVIPHVLEDLKCVSSTEFDSLLLAWLRMLGLSDKEADRALNSLLQHATDLCNAYTSTKTDKASQDLKAASKELRAALKTYCSRANEDDRYEPLVDALDVILTNFEDVVFDFLPNHPTTDLRFKVNDPVMLQAVHGLAELVTKRSPDIIAVIKEALTKGLTWKEALAYVELKFNKKIAANLSKKYKADRVYKTGIDAMTVDIQAHRAARAKDDLDLGSRLSPPDHLRSTS
ncbi:hypothetical protein C8J56DRAFT_1161610 [Mycena floridula]|nr:hypothetical protein C8J56DRAFT_1161610 [Mycena floridula]